MCADCARSGKMHEKAFITSSQSGDILAARLGAFDAEAELEILLVADENIGIRGYLGEYGVQLALPALPERIALIEVKRNRRAVLLGFLCKLKAEFARLG